MNSYVMMNFSSDDVYLNKIMVFFQINLRNTDFNLLDVNSIEKGCLWSWYAHVMLSLWDSVT